MPKDKNKKKQNERMDNVIEMPTDRMKPGTDLPDGQTADVIHMNGGHEQDGDWSDEDLSGCEEKAARAKWYLDGEIRKQNPEAAKLCRQMDTLMEQMEHMTGNELALAQMKLDRMQDQLNRMLQGH